MGGIRTDLDGRTTREKLWAVGEVACTGVHGASRLASNCLLEGLFFADRVARALSEEPEREWGGTLLVRAVPSTAIAPDLGAPHADHDCEPLRDQMRQLMTYDVGLTRTEARLTHAKRALGRVARQIPPGAWRSANQVLVARLIAQAARRRRESRGGHRGLDYPPRARVGGSTA